jgi:hypothetical protein
LLWSANEVFLLSPKICEKSGDQELDLGKLTRGLLFIPSAQVLTPVRFCSGECVGVFPGVLCCCCFEFGSEWGSGGQVCGFGIFLALIGLIGELHRPHRCKGFLWNPPSLVWVT